ncbi:hypothetical protein ACHAW6_008060 [Cyclotella cf. meneghiniana]
MTKYPRLYLLLFILSILSSTLAKIPQARLPPKLALSLRSLSRHSLFGVIPVVRGGDLDLDDNDDDDDEASDIDSDYGVELDELSEEEEGDLEQVVESQQNADADKDDNEEEESSRQREDPVEDSTSSSGPVKLTIKTNLQCPISDQCLEFTASGKRTVASLKQAISKTMRGRPPSSILHLKHAGRTLHDEETVSEILADVDEDDEEDQDDEQEQDTIGEDEYTKLKLTLDILPPIDPKFGLEFKEKAEKMSTQDLLEAYCLNAVGMKYGMELGEDEMEEYERWLSRDRDETREDESNVGKQAEDEGRKNDNGANQSLQIRKRAALLQKQMERSLSEETLRLMKEEHERVQAYLKEGKEHHASSSEMVYGLVPEEALTQQRKKGRALKGGATMNIKRVLQRNMNVNWADTTRNSLLFLFYGYFGGRNSFSRAFLLLLAPLCFFIQTRPVKVTIKQLFYAIGEPPGILLSLLPAPQQAIVSLDYANAIRGLYGEDVVRGESWYEDVEMGGEVEEEEADVYDEEEQ